MFEVFRLHLNINVLLKKISHHCQIVINNVIGRRWKIHWEFTNVYVTTIYTSPDSNVENANNIINKHANDLMILLPDCINIPTDDFNYSRYITIPGLLQYVNCLTRENTTLDLFFPMSRTLILVSNRRPLVGLITSCCSYYKNTYLSVNGASLLKSVWEYWMRAD